MSSKEQFEAWACKQWPYLAQEVRYRRDALPANDPRYMNYCSYDLQAAWESWQASRQALEIVLPESFPLGDGYGQGLDPEDTREAIEAAGVSVKA